MSKKIIIYDTRAVPGGIEHLAQLYDLLKGDVSWMPYDSAKGCTPIAIDFDDLRLVDFAKLSEEESNKLLNLAKIVKSRKDEQAIELIKRMEKYVGTKTSTDRQDNTNRSNKGGKKVYKSRK